MKYQFHNLELTFNQQAEVLEYSISRGLQSLDAITTAVELSVKVSFSYDDYHRCMLMSLTPKLEEHPFYGYIVAVRHEDLGTLCSVLFWLQGEGWNMVDAPASTSSKYTWG
jgi:hypothetical protein